MTLKAAPRPTTDHKLAIVGFAFRFPGPRGADFWSALWEGRHLVSTVDASRWQADDFYHRRESEPGASYTRAAGSLGEIDGFDAAFFGISPREAMQMDPQQRLLLELTWESLESGGIRPSTLRGSRCAVVAGFSGSDYGYLGAEDIAAVNSFSMTGINGSIAANRISYVFDLHGPSLAVDTACSSSLVAFHQACQAIRSDDADMAIVGAVNLHLHPLAFVAFSKASMLSKRGACRPFDAASDGYVRSEGGAVVIVRPLEAALADRNRIYAIVAGSGINCDGRTEGLTVPSANAQAALLRETYARAAIDPAAIDYIEAHGTGTAVGDPIEAQAIGEALGRRRPAGSPLRIGSVKSNIGHLETAAGMAGLVKAVLCLQHRGLPRSLHFDAKNPKIPFADLNIEVVDTPTALPADKRLVIGVNSFGFGGANAHVILESFRDRQTPRRRKSQPEADRGVPLLLSARSAAALGAAAANLAAWLRDRPDLPLYDIAYSCAFHRDRHPFRALLFAHDRDSAARALEAFGRDGSAPSVAAGRALAGARGPAFLYSGNGSQWRGMGGQLLAESEVFRQSVAEVDGWVRQYSDVSVMNVLAGSPAQQQLEATEVAQPVLFALQVGITRLLESWGVRPSAVAGHSVGEMAAAWACGALSLEHASYLVCERSAWQGTTRGKGAMTAVALGPEALSPLLRQIAEPPTVAAINSPRSVTVAGSTAQLDLLESVLRRRGVVFHRLALEYAFHSAFMDPIREGVEGALGRIAPRRARVPFYSTVTGEALPGESLDARYWWRNIRDPVRFGPALAAMLEAGESVFLEVGPQPILSGYVGECLRVDSSEGRVIATLSREQGGLPQLRLRAFEAVVAGCDVDLAAFFGRPGRLVDLPPYPWQRERYWLARSDEAHSATRRAAPHLLLGRRRDPEGFEWESHLDTQRAPAYADHKVGGEAILPAAAYVEMAFAAAAELDPAATHEVEDLEFRAPLALSDQRSQTVRFALNPADGVFTIRSRERMSGHAWRLHASGRVATLSGAAPASGEAMRIDASTLRAPISSDAHYRCAEGVGLEYGPHFRVVDEVWHAASVSGEEIRARLAAPGRADAAATQDRLPPAFLDGAFQLLIHAVESERTGGIAYVPARIGRVSLLRPHAESRFATARVARRGARSLVAHCTLYAGDGEVVAVAREVLFRAVRLRQSVLSGLSSLQARAIPGPLRSTLRRSALPASDKLVPACAARLHASARQEARWRYFKDVEPLLEALLAAFAASAHSQLQGEGDVSPRRLRTLQHWAGENPMPDPAALWTQMLRDYPDHAGEILWIGRLGMHLADVARGRLPAERFLPTAPAVEGGSTAPWMPDTADYARAVSDMVSLALATLPDGRRLRVLSINSEQSPSVAALLRRLDADRCDVAEATDTAPRDGPWDLIVVEDGLVAARDREQALSDLRNQMADGGLLVLLERHPSRAVVMAMDFLLPRAKSYLRVQPLSPAAWRADLARHGFQQSLVVEDVPGIATGSYLLIARAVAGAADVRAAEPPAQSRRWLVVAGKSGLSARLGAELAAELRSRSQPTELAESECVSAGQWEIALANARRRLGGVDSVVHLAGLHDQTQLPNPMLRRQTGRCEALAGMVAACSAALEKPECWAVSAGAAVPLLPAAVRESQRLKASADDAVYWGFARTAINENRDLSLRLADLAVPARADAALDLAEAMLQPDGEDEMILTPSGRFVVRMYAAPFACRPAHGDLPPSEVRLETALPGQLKNLRWTGFRPPEPREGEVDIEVRAAGLNFRDVMFAMGQLPDEAQEGGFAGATLGMEVAGVVRSIGRGVRGLAPGDEVIAFAPSGFATRVVTRASAVLPKPAAWTFEAAATVQTAFFTAYYALHHLGRLGRGERVLIHGAAGGVGLAAVQIAQSKGAEIFATAGSDTKRDLLRLLGVPHVLDSRSLGFADEILARTGGAGIDVVLNSLAGEAMRRSLTLLRSMGRFLELGKRDFYENTRVGLRPLRNNVSYHALDADRLMRERPDLTRSVMKELLRLFEVGTLHPLPYHAFRTQDAVDAFRFMQQSRHIGKIVLGFDVPPAADAGDDPARPRLELPGGASYLVTGGLGGFGMRTAQWLAERGARHLVLLGRSTVLDAGSRDAVAALRARGIEVRAERCDVADAAALRALLKDLRGSMPPLRGIVHAAAVYRDCLIRDLDRESIEAVLAPKVLGAANLHRLTRHLKLDFFVLYSSAAALIGNPGQASYAAANCYLEALADARRAAGLPALSVAWGPIEDAGYLARNPAMRGRIVGRLGATLRAAHALDALERMLLDDRSGMVVCSASREGLAPLPGSDRSPKYGALFEQAKGEQRRAQTPADLRLWASRCDDAEAMPLLTELLREEIAEILHMDAARIDLAAPLRDLGLDSLMGVELATAVEARFGVGLPAMALASAGSVEEVGRRILRELRHGPDADDAGAVQADVSEQVRLLARRHAGELDAETVEKIAAGQRLTAR